MAWPCDEPTPLDLNRYSHRRCGQAVFRMYTQADDALQRGGSEQQRAAWEGGMGVCLHHLERGSTAQAARPANPSPSPFSYQYYHIVLCIES